MDDVIENCQTTFEEDGVNQQTLDDLRKVGLFLFLQQIIDIVPGSSSYTLNLSCVEHHSMQEMWVVSYLSPESAGAMFSFGGWAALRNYAVFLIKFWGGCRAFDSFLCRAPLLLLFPSFSIFRFSA